MQFEEIIAKIIEKLLEFSAKVKEQTLMPIPNIESSYYLLRYIFDYNVCVQFLSKFTKNSQNKRF